MDATTDSPIARGSCILLGLLLIPGVARADTGPSDTGPSDVSSSDIGADVRDAGDVGIDTVSDVGADAPDTSADTSPRDATSDVRDGGDALDDADDATAGDVRDVTMDGGDVRDADLPSDGTSDTESDVDASDMRDTTPESDVGDVETRDVSAPSDVEMQDVATPSDVGDARDAAPRVQFSGRVELQSTVDASGVTVTLQRRPEEGETEEIGSQTTGEAGRFAFDELSPGRYQVELEKSGFVSVGETFELSSDRVATFELFRDQSVALRVRAVFPEGTSPPPTVDFELEGPRDTLTPEEPISVDGGEAVWTRDSLGVGRWTIRASASEFETVAFGFDARGAEGARRQLSVRLRMIPTDRSSVPVRETSGCSCGNDRGGGGGGGFRGTPGGRLSVVLLVGLGVLAMRRRRR
jgi:hypothetical protein